MPSQELGLTISGFKLPTPEKGGTKASSRQTNVSFSGGRRSTRHMVGSLQVSGAADAGGVCNGDGGSREASRAALG